LKNLALILAAGIGLGSLLSNCQKIPEIKESSKKDFVFGIKCEKDPYKFIPRGALVKPITIKTKYGIRGGFWYEEYYSKEDYKQKLKMDGGVHADRIFFDVNDDGILDVDAERWEELYSQFLEQQKIESVKR
jgi:hypothetical protein